MRSVKFSTSTRVYSTFYMKVTSLNIRSLKPKTLLVRENAEHDRMDCFIPTEKWLTQCRHACITEYQRTDFSLLHTTRKGKFGRRVGVLARESPLRHTITDVPHGDYVESVVLKSSVATLLLLKVEHRPTLTNATCFRTSFPIRYL